MDLSYSMSTSKKSLSDNAKLIAEEIGRLTPDYKIGFGSFSDKPITPFSSKKETYAMDKVPYPFKHHMDLTDDVEAFKQKVSETNLTNNVDGPESGLDAMAQAMLCGTLIGWRNDSRKVIIVITDNEQHYAGDGLLGGITRRFDMTCHDKGGNDFTALERLDYPSFDQVCKTIVSKRM